MNGTLKVVRRVLSTIVPVVLCVVLAACGSSAKSSQSTAGSSSGTAGPETQINVICGQLMPTVQAGVKLARQPNALGGAAPTIGRAAAGATIVEQKTGQVLAAYSDASDPEMGLVVQWRLALLSLRASLQTLLHALDTHAPSGAADGQVLRQASHASGYAVQAKLLACDPNAAPAP